MDLTGTALLQSLENQRAHVIGILDGLADEALLKPVLPTGWSCAGLVQHLALDVERFWFRSVVAGEPTGQFYPADDLPSAWLVADTDSPEDVLQSYRNEIELANQIITATPIDAPPAAWPDFFGDFRLPDLRAVMLHVITETACHAGHLDAARELLDGRTWLTL
ncbi:MAG TPA: DinB family protein [Mycobacteriales bacterium]|jgi:hypothetical protein|nr:DinB family protein [Mycobacteriales bacterium]